MLVFFNDGVSHLNARRVLNKTYYYLLKERKGLPLHGHHVIGHNTIPNMVPYLTGIQKLNNSSTILCAKCRSRYATQEGTFTLMYASEY